MKQIALRIDLQWNRGMNIFDNPNNVSNQLGDIDWFGLGALSKLKNVGPGNLTMFLSTRHEYYPPQR